MLESLRDKMLGELNDQEVYLAGFIENENYELEEEIKFLTKKNQFWFKIINGLQKALEFMSLKNEDDFSRKCAKSKESHNKKLLELEEERMEVINMIAKLEKDS